VGTAVICTGVEQTRQIKEKSSYREENLRERTANYKAGLCIIEEIGKKSNPYYQELYGSR